MSGQENQRGSARFSQMGEAAIADGQLYSSAFKLAGLNTGDQTARMQNMHHFMVKQKQWLSETQMNEIYNLCHNLPGPTTTQVISTIITLKLKSIRTAITVIFLYNLISWVLLTVLGFFSTIFLIRNQNEHSLMVSMAIMGCTAAGAGIMVRSFYQYCVLLSDSGVKIVLMLSSAAIYYFYKSKNSIVFCLTLGAIVSLYLEQAKAPKHMSSKSMNLFSSLRFNLLLGKPSLIILVGLFFSLWIFFSIFNFPQFQYIFQFYWIGCFILGPVEVIFAYFLSLLNQYPHINLTQTLLGVSFTFLIPGSHINIGLYFGSLIDGLRGAVLAIVCLYVPCFLFLLGMLPQWKYYREKGGIKRIFEGLVCSTTGLTLSVIIIIMEHCMDLDRSCAVCIFIMCAAINCFLSKYAFMTIIIGGFLGCVRYLSVYCYRMGTHCPFPFYLF